MCSAMRYYVLKIHVLHNGIESKEIDWIDQTRIDMSVKIVSCEYPDNHGDKCHTKYCTNEPRGSMACQTSRQADRQTDSEKNRQERRLLHLHHESTYVPRSKAD